MKSIVFRILLGTALMVSVISCNKDNDGNKNVEEERVEVVVHTGVDTRAYDTNWQYGDKIGITMYDPTYTNILEDQFNYEYITQLNLSIFYATDAGHILYFPLHGADMRLKSYYPYMANLPQDMNIHWRVDDQSNLPDIDLMTAEHVSGFNENVILVRLHFYHRLCKLVFLLDNSEDVFGIDLATCQLTIKGMETGNDYNLYSDTFGDNTDGIADITVPIDNEPNATASQRMAIVFPRPAGEGVEFIFTTPDGDVFTAIMSETLELETGNKYVFYITLTENPTFVTATIEPWIENDYEYIVAN